MAHPMYARGIGAWRAVGVMVLCLTGCSIRPLPENIAPVSTFDIVERIRCEVLDGVKHFGNDQAKAEKIMKATAIGYDFDFEIEEKNGESAGKLEFKRASFKGEGKGFFLDLSAQAGRERKNVRSFRIVDNLGDLAKERGERCSRTITTANGLYPITGKTGMGEVARTYVKLEILTDLARSEEAAKTGEVFSDELRFKTKFTAGVTPKIELVTVAGQFRLTNATLGLGVSRDDIHSVTVALSRGPADVDMVTALATKLRVDRQDNAVATFKGEPLIRPYRTVRRLIASRGYEAERRVVEELESRREVRLKARVVNAILRGTED